MTDKEKIRLQAIKIIDGLNKSCTPNPNGNIMECMAAAEIEALKLIVDYIDSLPKEEPVNEDLEEAAFDYAEACKYEDGEKLLCIEHFKAGAKYKEEQFEKNRLEHCNSITNEQAELEQKFVDQHIENNHRIPTFLDAIEYGMRSQKEQMMKGAFEFTNKHNDACVLASECLRDHGWFNLEYDFNDLFLYLSCVDELFAGKFSGKTKVIVIKED